MTVTPFNTETSSRSSRMLRTALGPVLGQQTGQDLEPARLVAPMLDRFMSTDRGFAAARKAGSRASRKKPDPSKSLDTDHG